ncbi:hypothetical protein C0J52_12730 [Blattella germanica]|nr:hypothetical protein C0J52_12730 [Blattella germanica]
MRMMSGDLEDGEIEDGEIPEDAGTAVVEASPEEKPRITSSPEVAKLCESATKSEALLVKAKRTSGATNQRHSGNEEVKGTEQEDDWAGVVEKAIQHAMKKKGQELNLGAENEEEDVGEGNVRWNKRRKRRIANEDGGKESKAMESGQVGSSGDEDDDYDDEMLFVRGASPMPGSYGSSPHAFHDEAGGYKEGGQFEEPYDSDYEQDEFVREDSGHKRGGRGGKSRLLSRGGGRGMMKKRMIGLKKPVGNLGKRLPNKRQQQRMGKPSQGPQQGSESICAFFMQGKCQKENECPYSHNAHPPRKMELCKFYLMGCCAKKDKCLYMHSDFPCKFFHSGLKCAAGNRCKFSHGNLTESLKEVLLKMLEEIRKYNINANTIVIARKRRRNLETKNTQGAKTELDNKTSDGDGAELTDEEGKLEIDVQQEDEGVEDEEEKGSSPSRTDNSTVNVQDVKDDTLNADKEQGETDNNSSSCSLEMAGLPLNLPKKQRELFLRIQQQQREAADLNSQDKSGKEDEKEMDEDQQEESWYSSDEEDASLADVLKNLSKQESSKLQQEQQKPLRQPSPSRTPPLPPSANNALLDGIKLSDINISEPISKLLSIIQQTTSVSSAGHTAETSESRSHTSKESTTTQIRDPRLASAEAHRRNSGANSQSPSAHESPRQDPRISKRANSRSQGHRTSIYSSTGDPSAGSVMQDESASDVEMKNMHVSQQQSNSSFEPGTNVDPRTNRASSSSSLPYALGDLDLAGGMDMKGSLGLPFKPVPMHKPATEIDASLTSHPPIQYKVVAVTIPWPDYSRLKLNVSDVQIRNDPRLRKLFKVSGTSSKRQNSPPPPPPSSPPPPPKQSPSNIARNDPRRRSAPMSPHSIMSPRIQETPPGYPDMMSQNPMGPPQNHMGIVQNPMGHAQNHMGSPQNPMGPGPNPMGLMHNPNMPPGMVPGMPSGLNFDPRLPRNPRNAPGLLGPAPLPFNYCPNTPKCDDMDDGHIPNPDPRMFYNQPPMDMQSHQPPPRNQGMHRSRTWKNNRKNRRFRPQHHERSFTPPI